MRFLLLLALLTTAGCEQLIGADDTATRLLLYAVPREPPTDGRSISFIGVEAVREDGDTPTGALCARVSVQLGTISDGTGATPTTVTDAGVTGCPSARCTYVVLPTSSPRRDFVIYEPPSSQVQDVVFGELFNDGADAAICGAGQTGPPVTTQVLTLQVPDVPLPPPDMTARSSDGGAS